MAILSWVAFIVGVVLFFTGNVLNILIGIALILTGLYFSYKDRGKDGL